ncbi:hydrogenase expression/formation protein hupJ [Bradyrhizobium sp. ORS 375]|uniref:[NiFe]-hydrogenase assembly chaperone HybE n=1 Tax=Bradyrhizobium sp. (strain ORS 375) TaxID=566679 RepID=UPI0002406927|nr:[NiFe]-hydrogenase assembly chaperone HybE [Bradyrhizobium sp. ORS 375]CCD93062.1 hydrogenase expression/formation protein hupJ [Bradyrhizobium sp. ORS 375]
MSAAAAGHGTDELAPAAWGERLAGVFREIGDRAVRELPIYHDALEVEAIGFTKVHERTIGIIVTPWFMNVVTPVGQGDVGSTIKIALPAGWFEFTIGDVAGGGRIASCSLFSPMSEFEDMAAARVAAEAALAVMLAAPEDEANAAQASRAVDRRAFLRGTFSERRP